MAAGGRFLLAPAGLLTPGKAGRELARTFRMIAASPTLLAHEHQVLARATAALAVLLAAETDAGPDDAEPWVAATAIVGLQRTLIAHLRRHAGEPGAAAGARSQVERALTLLEGGLAGYGVAGGSGTAGQR